MDNPFFEHPVLNSPYKYPLRYWELDDQGQPTQKIIERRRRAEFITPIPKPRKRKGSSNQQSLIFDEGKGLSSQAQQYDPTPVINQLRHHVDQWRSLPNPTSWRVTPETARLLQHWRHHKFSNIRPFFCQVEAVETVIRKLGLMHVIGLSATPFSLDCTAAPVFLDDERFFLDGYRKCGIVKLPRVSVADNDWKTGKSTYYRLRKKLDINTTNKTQRNHKKDSQT